MLTAISTQVLRDLLSGEGFTSPEDFPPHGWAGDDELLAVQIHPASGPRDPRGRGPRTVYTVVQAFSGLDADTWATRWIDAWDVPEGPAFVLCTPGGFGVMTGGFW